MNSVSDLIKFGEADFQSSVLESAEPVLVDFYADWCGPCKMMAPVVEELAGEYAGKLTVGKLDTDQNPDIAMRYQIMGIPTLGLFRDGRLVDRLVGYPGPMGVRTWLDRALNKAQAA